MAVSALDVGKRVRWTDGPGRTRTGTLHRLPEPGSWAWWRTAGRATVLVTGVDDDSYQWREFWQVWRWQLDADTDRAVAA